MMINNDILNAIINCKHKAYLKKNQLEELPKTDFDIVFDKLKKIQNSIIPKKLSVDTDLRQIDYLPNFRFEKHKTYLQILFKNSEANLILDGIYIDDKNYCIPILISPFEKVQKSDRLFVALQDYYLRQHFNLKIEEAKIIFGEQQKSTKLLLNKFSKEVKKTVDTIEQIKRTEQPTVFYKNTHYFFCEYNSSCDEKLKERDDLSLLGNLKPKEIEQKNNRGIFSVKQLSYTFRAKRNPYRKRKFLPELKALAICEQKVFIRKLPELEKKETEIFFDIEGLPDKNFYYLIGVIIKTESSNKEHYFWANDITEQRGIFEHFIDLLANHNNFIAYHYGSYEVQALKRISKKLSQPTRKK